jgi:RNA polymerase sigma-70 factor (ECF subfamily)
MSDVEDRSLLAAHVAGDTDAFGRLFARHADRLWSLAVRTLGNPHDAEEVLQEAMLSAFRRAGSFRGQSAVLTWLHRIVVNACYDRLRHDRVRPSVPLSDETAARLESPGPGPEQVALAVDTALLLVDGYGYSMEEAAGILGCAPGTVKSRCSRGRRALAPLLRHVVRTG